MPVHHFPPALGTLVVDTNSADRVGEFRGVTGPRRFLRPVRGGAGWEAEPVHVRPATPVERLRAENSRRNARSRGEVL
ncbi:hypothetical protein OG875_11295 [Streptomyces sp. NBC_01498]|uniref:hypothetical protein n=1 Tax=Streptomyces sp. NBC_01498 TaxID=2975870 RepID=UPI002E7ADF9A|nr:hypothetical protein [Streptomyces sp. NBC_01498]WTL25128.1 hypothetical protein OG875_11295 [Streptomyces sp. NBC_01498]